MYLPRRFRDDDAERLRELVTQHPFAALMTAPVVDGAPAPFVTHLPLSFDERRGPRGTLRGHVARANPQWRHFAEPGEVLAVFCGPHAFVSSMWSEAPAEQVPTWNYLAAHAYGRARVLDDSDALGVLAQLMDAHQPEHNPVPLDPPAPLARELVQAIVAFEIEVTRWEVKAKLSQNRSAADRQRIEEALRARGGRWDGDIAEAMGRSRAGR